MHTLQDITDNSQRIGLHICKTSQVNPQTQDWQREYLFQRTTDIQSGRKKNPESTTAVWRNGWFSALYDSFVIGSSAVLRLNFSAKNPPLRQAAKRWVKPYKTTLKRNYIYEDRKPFNK